MLATSVPPDIALVLATSVQPDCAPSTPADVAEEVGASHSRERGGLEEELLQLLPPAANQRC